MDTFEKLIWGLTGTLVAGVIALIVIQSVFQFNLSPSTVSEDEADAMFDVLNRGKSWQAVSRPDVRGTDAAGGVFGAQSGAQGAPGRLAAGRSGRAGAGDGSGERGGAGADGAAGATAGGPGAGFDRAGGAGPSTPIGSAGWSQGAQSGVYEAPEVYLPYMLVDRYRHADQARDALQSAESWDVDYGGQTAVRLGAISPDSPLAKYLGLQQGDTVISVNGYAVSRANGMSLHSRLKDETKFRVEIDRGGTRFIAKYEIR